MNKESSAERKSHKKVDVPKRELLTLILQVRLECSSLWAEFAWDPPFGLPRSRLSHEQDFAFSKPKKSVALLSLLPS